MTRFENYIDHLLAIALVPKDLRTKLTSPKNLEIFKQAFTHPTISETRNYEVFECIGDTSLNKCVIWFFKRRLPEANPELLTLLKIKFASTDKMSIYARELGLDKYILSNEDQIKTRSKILEDVLESFIGCMEYLIDEINGMHSGYSYVYTFVSVYIERYLAGMSIKEQDLLDAISKLKNLSDKHKFNVEYIHETVSIRGLNHVTTSVNINKKMIVRSTARVKKQSKIHAAELALQEIETNHKHLLKNASRSKTPPSTP